MTLTVEEYYKQFFSCPHCGSTGSTDSTSKQYEQKCDSTSKQDEQKCDRCGAPVVENHKSFYRCGVIDCRYECPAPSGIFIDKVITCPKCKNETLILYSESTETCSNPKCGHTEKTQSKGGSCYVATLALPAYPEHLEALRSLRDMLARSSIMGFFIQCYYSAQPFLEDRSVSKLTHKCMLRAGNHAMSVADSSKHIQHLLPSIALFVVGFFVHALYTIKIKCTNKASHGNSYQPFSSDDSL